MADDSSQSGGLSGIFANDAHPLPPCRLCGNLICWSAEIPDGDICRHCAEVIADPATLKLLAHWFDSPYQPNAAVVCQLGGKGHTLGTIFREMADAIELQAGARIAEPGEPAADRSTGNTAADVPTIDAANDRGADDDDL